MILTILRILGQFRELFVGPGHLAATTSNWESAAAECHQCHGCNTFGGVEIEIELHTRKLNMSLKKGTISTGNNYIFQPLIFKGHVSFPGWKTNGWKAQWQTETSPILNPLSRSFAMFCLIWTFRLKLKKICLSASINMTHAVHVSCAQVFVDLLFWSRSPSSRWLCFVITCCFLKVFSVQLCCLFWWLYSLDVFVRFVSMFVFDFQCASSLFWEIWTMNSYHTGNVRDTGIHVFEIGWIPRATHGPSIRLRLLRLWHRHQQLRRIECLAQELGFFVAWILKPNCRAKKSPNHLLIFLAGYPC